jgi:hypothetical protein
MIYLFTFLCLFTLSRGYSKKKLVILSFGKTYTKITMASSNYSLPGNTIIVLYSAHM